MTRINQITQSDTKERLRFHGGFHFGYPICQAFRTVVVVVAAALVRWKWKLTAELEAVQESAPSSSRLGPSCMFVTSLNNQLLWPIMSAFCVYDFNFRQIFSLNKTFVASECSTTASISSWGHAFLWNHTNQRAIFLDEQKMNSISHLQVTSVSRLIRKVMTRKIPSI